MIFSKITKEDIKNTKRELSLTIGYTLALSIVYTTWSFVEFNSFWVSLIIFIGFVVLGCLFYYFWVLKIKEKNEENK